MHSACEPVTSEPGGKSLLRDTAEWLAREFRPGPVRRGDITREVLAERFESGLRYVADVSALRAELDGLPVSGDGATPWHARNGAVIDSKRLDGVRSILLRHQADELIKRLRAFVELHGHPLAIFGVCDDHTLAGFVENTLNLSEDGEDALSWYPPGLLVELRQLGLLPAPTTVWQLRNLFEFTGKAREWNERLEAGVPRGGSHSMASQVSRMRRRIREGKFDPRVVALLKSLSFPIVPDSGVKCRAQKANIRHAHKGLARRADASWKATLKRVKKRAKAQGHYRFACKSKDGIWLRHQLRFYREGKLSAARVALLDKAGVPLTTRPRGRPARDAAPWGDIRGKRISARGQQA